MSMGIGCIPSFDLLIANPELMRCVCQFYLESLEGVHISYRKEEHRSIIFARSSMDQVDGVVAFDTARRSITHRNAARTLAELTPDELSRPFMRASARAMA